MRSSSEAGGCCCRPRRAPRRPGLASAPSAAPTAQASRRRAGRPSPGSRRGALPGSEEERVVAEEDVVAPAPSPRARRTPPAGLRSWPPIRPRRAPESGARPSRPRRRGEGDATMSMARRRKSATRPAASAVLKKGRTKTSAATRAMRHCRSAPARARPRARRRRTRRGAWPGVGAATSRTPRAQDRDESREETGRGIARGIRQVAEDRQPVTLSDACIDRPASTRSVSQNGVAASVTIASAQSLASSSRAREQTAPCDARTSAPYGWLAIAASVPSAHSAHRRVRHARPRRGARGTRARSSGGTGCTCARRRRGRA